MFMLLAGTNFALHFRMITGDIRSVVKNTDELVENTPAVPMFRKNRE